MVDRIDPVGHEYARVAGGGVSPVVERLGRSSLWRRATIRRRTDCQPQNAEGWLMSHAGPTERGFSLIELLIATTLLLVVMATVFQTMNPVYGAFRLEPEPSDFQKR